MSLYSNCLSNQVLPRYFNLTRNIKRSKPSPNIEIRVWWILFWILNNLLNKAELRYILTTQLTKSTSVLSEQSPFASVHAKMYGQFMVYMTRSYDRFLSLCPTRKITQKYYCISFYFYFMWIFIQNECPI